MSDWGKPIPVDGKMPPFAKAGDYRDLKALSDAATQEEWREAGGDAILTGRNGDMIVIGSLHANPNDPPFVTNLVNAYRAGKLVEADRMEAMRRLAETEHD